MTDKKPGLVIIAEDNLPANPLTPMRLLEMAVQQNFDIDKLQQLMNMKKEWDAEEARKKYFEAVSKFQSIVPELTKSKKISFGNTSYKFAPLGEIEAQIKEPMYQCGLSKRWELSYPDNKIQCDCIITHKDGHSEHTIMLGEKDTSGNKNLMQQNASAVTYLQRYTLIAALGLATADEDNDAQTAGKGNGDNDNSSSTQQESSNRPTEWLNEGSEAWREMVKRIAVDGEPAADVLKDMKSKFRVNKNSDAVILAMKKGDKAAAPVAEKKVAPSPAGKVKPKITAADKEEWNKINEEPFTDFSKASPKMKAYNNNVVKLASGDVSLKTVTDTYDLDEDVLIHYTAIAKRKE